MTTADQNARFVPLFPDLPREEPAIKEDGNFNQLWSLGLSSLFQALQTNFKSEGIVLPSLTSQAIGQIQAIYDPSLIGNPIPVGVPDISGQTVFDSTNRIPKQFIITYDNSTPKNIVSAQWVQINVMITSKRDPNYVAGPPIIPAYAGQVGWLCYNTGSGSLLYLCTTSGGTGVPNTFPTAVWTAV